MSTIKAHHKYNLVINNFYFRAHKNVYVHVNMLGISKEKEARTMNNERMDEK